MIFSILLDKPEEFELPMKPSGRREHNFMCTLDMQKVTLASARADDNGTYSRHGNISKYFYVTDKICKLAHRMDSGEFFINVRDHSSASRYPVYRKEFVEASKVFLLQRFYRYSKSNNFYNMIATITLSTSKQPHNYYMYLSRWNGSDSDKKEEQFFVERHGNSKNSHASSYYRKDTSLMDNIKEHLKKGVSVDEVYVELSKENESVSSVSQLVHNPKMIHNLK